ncbi:DUF1330 domain-containing protein [Paraburkholderia sp. RL17-347-BIC-D]|uniref:DUF1330 domain-containing protein n=1 Tax=Paraburkholderia sp. RL17-347-BIC-D TaxID=3031632 RepID=UPI0038BC4BFD
MAARGYLIAELDVFDEAVFYSEYMEKVGSVLESYGARFLVATDRPEVIEGDRKVKRVVLLEFETFERAKEFYFSEQYQEVAAFRFRSAHTHLCILEGHV